MEKEIKKPELMFKDGELSKRAYVTYIWFVNNTSHLDQSKPLLFDRKLFKQTSEYSSDTTIYKAIAELLEVGLIRSTTRLSHYIPVVFSKPVKQAVEEPDLSEWYTDSYHEYKATLDPNKDNEERLQGFLEGLAWSLK